VSRAAIIGHRTLAALVGLAATVVLILGVGLATAASRPARTPPLGVVPATTACSDPAPPLPLEPQPVQQDRYVPTPAGPPPGLACIQKENR
jgi:hypothetical protein